MSKYMAMLLSAMILAGTASALLSSASEASMGVVSVEIGKSPEHVVRLRSGESLCEEGLVAGQWVGMGRRLNGHADAASEAARLPAFQIEVMDSPEAKPQPVSNGWRWVSAGEVGASVKGRRHLVVELANTVFPLTVKVHTLLDGTSVLTRWLQITSTSSKPVALVSVAPWSGRLWSKEAPVAAGYSVIQNNQRTGSFAWRELKSGATTIQNAHEPCYDDPYFILRSESNGEYFFGQLAWPSLYSMEFDRTTEGLSFRIGPMAVGGVLRVIAPGETVETPAVHLCHSKGDFDGVVQEMHEHVRRSVLPKNRPDRSYRIEYIANGDTGACLYKGDDFNESNLRPCIDVAAAIGAETFLIDGPFWAETGGKHAYLWERSSAKLFPTGMKALRDYAHEKGLLFGVYARTEGRDMLTSGDPDMYEYVGKTIDTHGLDLYRHDTSEDQWGDWVHSLKQDGFDECVIWRHHDTFYKAAERIHHAYPDVILQQAAAGGARSDLATLGRWQESFQSDMTPTPLVYQMMAGFSVYLPPEAMQSAYLGMWGVTPANRETLMRSVFTLGNIPCVYWTLVPGKVSEIKPDDLRQLHKYAQLYKSFIRPMLPTCKVFHHAPINAKGNWDTGHWFAMEYASPDRTKAWATIISLPDNPSTTYRLVPKGLDPRKTYKVTFDNAGKARTVTGASLMRDGLSLEVAAEGSELLLFAAE